MMMSERSLRRGLIYSRRSHVPCMWHCMQHLFCILLLLYDYTWFLHALVLSFVIALYLHTRLLVTCLVSERRSCKAFSSSWGSPPYITPYTVLTTLIVCLHSLPSLYLLSILHSLPAYSLPCRAVSTASIVRAMSISRAVTNLEAWVYVLQGIFSLNHDN